VKRLACTDILDVMKRRVSYGPDDGSYDKRATHASERFKSA